MGNHRRSHQIVIQIVIKGRAQAHFPHFRLSMEMNSLLFILALFGAAAAHGIDATAHSHTNGLAHSDPPRSFGPLGPQEIVQEFITRIERSVKSKDVAAISNLFAHDSLFTGCNDIYNKKRITAMLSRLPTADKFSFNLDTVVDLGNRIQFNTTIVGFEKHPVIAEFVLLESEHKLASGVIKSCPKPDLLNNNYNNSLNI